MKKLPLIIGLLYSTFSNAQYNDSDIHKYIEQYKQKAINEQLRTGIPAGIKLAQGIIETGAGTSELCNNASNHFGIKCKSNWSGMTYSYTDDAKDECFRKYDNWERSFEDHSDFLKQNKRYASLFEYDVKDYVSWCNGLKKAGYATSPTYAPKLIRLIEKYNLQQYTDLALHAQPIMTKSPTTAEILSMNIQPIEDTFNIQSASEIGYYKPTKLHGIEGFYAKKGDHLLEYAVKNRIRYVRILEINEIPDAPLPYDMFIYLDRKNSKGSRPETIVNEGENLHFIAQREGITVPVLRALNLLLPNEEPEIGQTLQLINIAVSKPILRSETIENSNNIANIPDANNVSQNTEHNYISKSEIESNGKPLFTEKQNEKIAEQVDHVIPIEPIKETTPVQTPARDIPVAPASELDKMKQKFDRKIYGSSQDYSSDTRAESKEFLKINTTTQNAPAPISNKPDLNKKASTTKSGNATNPNNQGNVQDKLRKHMNNLEKENSNFKPKSTGIEGNTGNASAKPKATPKTTNAKVKKTTNTAKKSNTQKVTSNKKATTTKKSTAKPTPPKKKK